MILHGLNDVKRQPYPQQTHRNLLLQAKVQCKDAELPCSFSKASFQLTQLGLALGYWVFWAGFEFRTLWPDHSGYKHAQVDVFSAFTKYLFNWYRVQDTHFPSSVEWLALEIRWSTNRNISLGGTLDWPMGVKQTLIWVALQKNIRWIPRNKLRIWLFFHRPMGQSPLLFLPQPVCAARSHCAGISIVDAPKPWFVICSMVRAKSYESTWFWNILWLTQPMTNL